MSETFRVGDNVVFRDASGALLARNGIAQVISSDLSTITVNRTNYGASHDFNPLDDAKYFWSFNAGSLKYKHDPNSTMIGEPEPFFVAHPTEDEHRYLCQVAENAAAQEKVYSLTEQIESILTGEDHSPANLESALAVLSGQTRQCHTCQWWRPPFDAGPGNCHNEQVKQLTNIGGDTYAPPTPAHFGCVQWESKDQPENGEE